ncbi:hypothetical protein OEZ60_22175 [Defluviimonas sp. WL0024]|uniref:Uncharacterized protein n=1 Tax=Albidovulum salinarum TaxID=2984153 RepID=A0ABT2X9P7_9RHOB|nr:hypothetical protein [Defluviimonas sp. WL0024]MCU9850678.1 hypothetical protein [Defluviimonas sp. WL0024]
MAMGLTLLAALAGLVGVVMNPTPKRQGLIITAQLAFSIAVLVIASFIPPDLAAGEDGNTTGFAIAFGFITMIAGLVVTGIAAWITQIAN